MSPTLTHFHRWFSLIYKLQHIKTCIWSFLLVIFGIATSHSGPPALSKKPSTSCNLPSVHLGSVQRRTRWTKIQHLKHSFAFSHCDFYHEKQGSSFFLISTEWQSQNWESKMGKIPPSCSAPTASAWELCPTYRPRNLHNPHRLHVGMPQRNQQIWPTRTCWYFQHFSFVGIVGNKQIFLKKPKQQNIHRPQFQ